MNSWTIYWILQLDSINNALGFATFCAAAVVAAMCARYIFCATADPEEWHAPENKRSAERRLAAAPMVRSTAIKTAALLLAPLWMASALCPTTKTAAAMVIVPAIANNETIRNEAGDLYQLAKQALRDAVTDGKVEPERKP